MEGNEKKIRINLISVVACQILTIAIGFLLPRLYIENFGSSVNGVLSMIKQIFTYLGLLEAGIGLATMQALYKPVAQDDRSGINGILTATKHYYTVTGIFYFAAVTVIAFVYAFLIDTGLPPITIIALVYLNAIPSIYAFLVEQKYSLLIETDGRQYIITNSQIALQLLSGFAKVAVLLLTENLILMQASYCFLTLLQLLYITVYAKRRYAWLDLTVPPDKKSISQKNSVFIHQISGMIFNNTDILLLSFLTNFNVVSVYYIYNLFFTQVETFINNFVRSFNFALGQMFHVDREKFLRSYDVYEMCYIAVNFFIYTLMCVFLLPVIQIYTGGIHDAEYINPTLLLLFVICKLLNTLKAPAGQVIEYSGHFQNTKWHAIVEMILNLSVSVLAILRFGICGALAGTVAASLFRSTVMIFYTNRKILNRNVLKTYVLLLINGGLFLAVFLIFQTTHFSGMRFWPLVGQGLLNAPWIAAMFLAANAIIQPSRFKQLILVIKGRFSKHEREKQ